MRRLIVIILAVSMFLSVLCGHAFATETETNKYEDVIGALDAGNYDLAIEYIRRLQAQSLEGNAADYLVEVELTEDNFDEYFEFAKENRLNEFGEPEETNWEFGLISKKFEEGLVVYEMDDIPIEMYDPEYGDTFTSTIECLLFFGYGVSGPSEVGDYQLKRLGSGKITFVPKEYVVIDDENVDPNGFGDLKIEEKNEDGSTSVKYRSIYREHYY